MVNPWTVSGDVDYDYLIKKFGTQPITPALLDRFRRVTKKPLDVMLRRLFFFSHRDLDKILDDVEHGKRFFIYTGRGPSGPMHVGHLIPLMFTKYLQECFDTNVYIVFSDDEKFVVKNDKTWKDIDHWTYENMLDVAAIGFDPDKTFMFVESEYIKNIYRLVLRIARKTTFSKAQAVFGFTNSTNLGHIFYPNLQITPTFFEPHRCLIPNAIDQDPYWRIQRDIAESLGGYKTAAIHSKFIPPLTGMSGKMSSSDENSAIWLSDSPSQVKKKIMKYAFSGGQPTVEEHRKKGGNPDIDVCFNWLSIFLEPDDNKIKQIYDDYRAGKLLTGELKQITAEKLTSFLEEHQRKRDAAKSKLHLFRYDGKLAQEMWNKTYS